MHHALAPVSTRANFDFRVAEENWKERVSSDRGPRISRDPQAPPYYALVMFPYPSGLLHMGHVRVYAISDCLARFKRLQGYNVLHPMGWDAFGLPAENAAIERQLQPSDWTYSNITQMKAQMSKLCLSYDWDRELATCDASYYQWTQWLFLQLHKKGLAYQQESLVNWDPIDCTVLANEQVDAMGKSWRSGAVVESKMLKQWFFRITEYAQQLVDGLSELDGWPSDVKAMQRQWIGPKHGVTLPVQVSSSHGVIDIQASSTTSLTIFTTRPETIEGCTFVALSVQHPLLDQVPLTTEEQDHLQAWRSRAAATRRSGPRSAPGTEGMILSQVHAHHPVTGAAIPLAVADYVLPEVGTQAVMAVPAHDERDFAFACAHKLPMAEAVIDDVTGQWIAPSQWAGRSFVEDSAAMRECWTAIQATPFTSYRLKDWLVSRQRYWGAPIPIIHCDDCGAVPVPESDLPVRLPEQVHLTGKGSILSQLDEWKRVACPCCGRDACRETDTMDTFVDSSFYFFRYTDPTNTQALAAPELTHHYCPVDIYVGGIEHAILHLLYARFISSFLHDCGLSPSREPFQRLLTQGMVLGKTYKRNVDGRYCKAHELNGGKDADLEGNSVSWSWEKMSKSKYNGIDPDDVVGTWGADTVRLYTLFKAPPPHTLEWDSASIEGQARWLQRLQQLVNAAVMGASVSESEKEEEKVQPLEEHARLVMASNHAIRQVTRAFQETLSLNTAVADLMKLSNTLSAASPTVPSFQSALTSLLIMLYPMAPTAAAQLYSELHGGDFVGECTWPVESALPAEWEASEKSISVFVNGRMRGCIQVPVACVEEAEFLDAIQSSVIGEKYLEDQSIQRVILAKNGATVSLVTQQKKENNIHSNQ
jgi:leucyl-tRNA synthetase